MFPAEEDCRTVDSQQNRHYDGGTSKFFQPCTFSLRSEAIEKKVSIPTHCDTFRKYIQFDGQRGQ